MTGIVRMTLGAVIVAVLVPPAGAWPGCEVDQISATVVGDTLTVLHEKAAYNCCMDGTDYSVTQDASTIHIQETELLTIPCLCLCCFNLSVQVADLAAGLYTVVFTWWDYDTSQWEEWTDQVTIGGGGGQPQVVAATNSGCLDPAIGAPRGVESGTWGRVKALYQ